MVWNLILFMLLSFTFILLQKAIYFERSMFNIVFIKETAFNYQYLIGLILITALLIFNLSKLSKLFYFITTVSVIIASVLNLIDEFSKLVLIVLAIYTLVSYYYYYLLDLDLNYSFYNPGYSQENLFEPMLLKLPCRVIENEKSFQGYLTNWDDSGCFIKSKEEIKIESNIIKIEFDFGEKKFLQNACPVSFSKDGTGLGVKFKENEGNIILNWKELESIINDMGLDVEFIK